MPRKCLRRVPMLAEASHVPLTNCCPIRGGSTSIWSHHNTQLSLIELTQYPSQRCTVLLKSWYVLLPMPYQARYDAPRCVSLFRKAVDPSTGQIQFNSNIHIEYLIFILILSYLLLVSSLQDLNLWKTLCLCYLCYLSYLSLPLWYYHLIFCTHDKLRYLVASSVRVRRK